MISKKLSIVHCQLSIILAFLPLSVAYAQQDSTLNRTVVVENEYNPNIMDASKINVLPRVEEPAVMKKGIEYATALRPDVYMKLGRNLDAKQYLLSLKQNYQADDDIAGMIESRLEKLKTEN